MSGRTQHGAGGAQEGFTLIEVVIAVFVASLLFAAMAATLVSNNKSSLENQRQVQLASVLQQQIERVHQILTQNYSSVGFAGLALSSNPAQGTDSVLPGNPTDPNDFITPYVNNFVTATSSTAENFLIEQNYSNTLEQTISGASYAEELEVDPTNGKVPPVSYVDLATGTYYTNLGSIPSGDPYATFYTYVTRASNAVNGSISACSAGQSASATTDDTRRVIVAAKLSAPPGRTDVEPNLIQYASTEIVNPIPSNQCQSANGLRLGLNIR